nr:MAG TPA: hypothetical protein [Caudoviricetes sp.]
MRPCACVHTRFTRPRLKYTLLPFHLAPPMQARNISARQTSGHSHASHCQRIQEHKARAGKVFTAPPCSAAPACLIRFVAIATDRADGHRQRLRTRKNAKSSDKSEFCKISCNMKQLPFTLFVLM